MKLFISRNVKHGLQNRKIIHYTYFRPYLTKYIFKNILICKYYFIQDNSKLKIKIKYFNLLLLFEGKLQFILTKHLRMTGIDVTIERNRCLI